MLLLLVAPACQFGLAGCGSDTPLTEAPVLIGSDDGRWQVTRISGKPVPPDSFLVVIEDGRITGGRDGCNNWGFDDSQPPLQDGSRMIVSDAQGCAETPEMRAYRSVAMLGVERVSRSPARLTLRAKGHQLSLRSGEQSGRK